MLIESLQLTRGSMDMAVVTVRLSIHTEYRRMSDMTYLHLAGRDLQSNDYIYKTKQKIIVPCNIATCFKSRHNMIKRINIQKMS